MSLNDHTFGERTPAMRVDQILTNPPLIMTLIEAASYLRCSSRKLRDLIQKRRVRHARVGAKIVIRRAWLDDFIDKGA